MYKMKLFLILFNTLILFQHLNASVNISALDKSVSNFVDSGVKVFDIAAEIFSQELNGSITNSNAKDIWVAYSKVFQHIIGSGINEFTSKMMDKLIEVDVSDQCVTGLFSLLTGLRLQKEWAVKCNFANQLIKLLIKLLTNPLINLLTNLLIKILIKICFYLLVLDSSGRPLSSGVLHGTITDLGDYDQCLDINVNDEERDEPMFVGQYCLAKFSVPVPRPKPDGLTLQSKIFNFTGTNAEGTVSKSN